MILRKRKGMLVQKTEDGLLLKKSFNVKEAEWLKNSWRFLQAMKHTGFAPYPRGIEIPKNAPEHVHVRMDFIEANPITDKMTALRQGLHLLLTLRMKEIVHGDLTDVNVIWSNNIPVAIDWDQSNFAICEARPQKRPKDDATHFYPVILKRAGDPSRLLRRWMAVREHIKYYRGWGTFLDIGTHKGETVAMAKIDGFIPYGIDNETIRPCIDIANEWWGRYGCHFTVWDALNFAALGNKRYNVISMLSTWPYIYNKNNIDGIDILKECVERSDIFVFETQLCGDGPGPEFLKTKDDVIQLLKGQGAKSVEEAITIPVDGRDAERTTWIVK